jgi:hypothetical protein
MTVPNIPNQVSFIGTGSVGPFTFAFPFFNNNEILAIVTDLSGNATTALVASLIGANTNTGGVLTLVNALPVGFVLSITRIVIIEQQTELPDGGPFFAQTIESALDYLTMICQQLVGQIQTIRFVNTAVGTISYIEGDSSLGIDTIQYAGNGELVVWKKDATANIVKILPPEGWTINRNTEYDLYTQGDYARFIASPTSNDIIRIG